MSVSKITKKMLGFSPNYVPFPVPCPRCCSLCGKHHYTVKAGDTGATRTLVPFQSVLHVISNYRHLLSTGQCQHNILNTNVAVGCGYSTSFVVRTCDGLYHLIFSIDHVGIPTDRMDLCQTHCKQVPEFFPRPSSCGQVWTNHHPLAPSNSYQRVYIGCALAVVYQVCSLYVPS